MWESFGTPARHREGRENIRVAMRRKSCIIGFQRSHRGPAAAPPFSRMQRPAAIYAGIRSAALKKATGRTWREWITRLNAAGAKAWTHDDVVQWLHQKQKVADWWCRRVAEGYEQACGRRVKQPVRAGFTITLNQTVAAPVATVFAAWRDPELREAWLPGAQLVIRKATPHKSIRIIWSDGTLLSVNFWPKGSLKCQVVPEHSGLADPAAAERWRNFWTERLAALRTWAEAAAKA